MWIFVLASYIGALAVAFVFKQSIATIVNELERTNESDPVEQEKVLQKVRTSFFVKVPLFEAPGIILIVIGLIFVFDMTAPLEVADILSPLLLVVAALAIALMLILSSSKTALTNPAFSDYLKGQVRILGFIAFPLATSVPIMAIVALFLMTAV